MQEADENSVTCANVLSQTIISKLGLEQDTVVAVSPSCAKKYFSYLPFSP